MAQEQTENKGMLTSLTSKVMAFLGLDDAGKVNKFFERQISEANKSIKSLKINLEITKSQHQADIEERDDAIEDAREVVENSLLNVDIEKISTNEKSKKFAIEYWNNFESAQKRLDELIEDKSRALEAHERAIKEINDIINAYQNRIDLISK